MRVLTAVARARLCRAAALLLLCLGCVHASEEAIWIEGEQPTGGVVAPWTSNPPSHPE